MLRRISTLALAVALLSSVRTAGAEEKQPGCLPRGEIEKRHTELSRALPKTAQESLTKHFPKAKLVASCTGSFRTAGEQDRFVMLLEVEKERTTLRVVRAIVLADGRVEVLDWTVGPTWKYAGNAEACGTDHVFYGEQRCLTPATLDPFLKGFLDGFQDSKVTSVNPRKQESACFAFDPTYNNWQCFAYDAKNGKFVRWGYQAAAD